MSADWDSPEFEATTPEEYDVTIYPHVDRDPLAGLDPEPYLDAALDLTTLDEVAVDRILGTLRHLRGEVEQIEAIAEARIRDVTDWVDARTAIARRAIEHREALLEAWHRHLLDENPDRKSVSLPCGTLKSRATAERVEILDRAVFVEWARESAPELVREKREHVPDKKALPGPLRPALTEPVGETIVIDSSTGEEVPGVAWIDAGRSFTVEVNEEGSTDASRSL